MVKRSGLSSTEGTDTTLGRQRRGLQSAFVAFSLLGILLSRNSLVRRTRSVERPASDRIDRRYCTLEASRVLAPAIGQCRFATSESGETRENDKRDRISMQTRLLRSFQGLTANVACRFRIEFHEIVLQSRR